MSSPLLILTGASGVGKTTVSRAVAENFPDVLLFEADSLDPPPADFVESLGACEGPGGSYQRSRAFYWIGQLSSLLPAGRPILLDYQCRIAFLKEALLFHRVRTANIVLVECTRLMREERLHGRGSPELVHEEMHNWSLYLHEEAVESGLTIVDTCELSIPESVRLFSRFLVPDHEKAISPKRY